MNSDPQCSSLIKLNMLKKTNSTLPPPASCLRLEQCDSAPRCEPASLNYIYNVHWFCFVDIIHWIILHNEPTFGSGYWVLHHFDLRNGDHSVWILPCCESGLLRENRRPLIHRAGVLLLGHRHAMLWCQTVILCKHHGFCISGRTSARLNLFMPDFSVHSGLRILFTLCWRLGGTVHVLGAWWGRGGLGALENCYDMTVSDKGRWQYTLMRMESQIVVDSCRYHSNKGCWCFPYWDSYG